MSINFNFRALLPEEVEVRPNKTTEKAVQLLLYQDARCAMNILDSTLGPTAWQREYYEAAGLLFCKIGIYDSETNQWLWKSDTGSKSNIEEDKGLASDAFKRAAVAWGIGRELYTAPRVTISLVDKDYFNGKLCQSFTVGEMDVVNGTIRRLTILDRDKCVRYQYPVNEVPVASSIQKSEDNCTSPGDRALNDFFSSMKNDADVDQKRLKEFYAFYTKPSKENPSLSIAAYLKGFDPQAKWQLWLERPQKN